MKRLLLIMLLLIVPIAGADGAGNITSPEDYFGYMPGADRELIDYEELIGYLQKLDSESPMLKIVAIGESPMGRDIYIAFISSAEKDRKSVV